MRWRLFIVLILAVLCVSACGEEKYKAVDLPVVETAEAGIGPEGSGNGD